MAINFPTNAQNQLNNGDQFTDATSGITWQWDTVSWQARGVSPTGLVSNIQDLANVTISSVQDNQVLTYTAAQGWHNAAASSGSGSLLFEDAKGQVLTRTPSGDGDKNKFTISFWFKQCQPGVRGVIMSATNNGVGSNEDGIFDGRGYKIGRAHV